MITWSYNDLKVDTQEVRTKSSSVFHSILYSFMLIQSPADNLPQDNEARPSLPNLQGWGGESDFEPCPLCFKALASDMSKPRT